MEQALGRATNICSDGIGMILEYLDFRWSHSNKITDAEANVAARLINTRGRRLEPWTVQHGFDATAFVEPSAELMLFLRNSTGICIYVPPTSQMQKHKTLGSPTSYYGRPCRVGNLRDSSIYQLTVVLRIDACDLWDIYLTSDLWLTNSDSYITSVGDILCSQPRAFHITATLDSLLGNDEQVRRWIHAARVHLCPSRSLSHEGGSRILYPSSSHAWRRHYYSIYNSIF